MPSIFRVLTPTRDFNNTVAFFAEAMGFEMEAQALTSHDTPFVRQTSFRMPNGVLLDVVEPKDAHADRYIHPVISLTVNDLAATRQHIEAQGIAFFTPTIDGPSGRRWSYFDSSEGYPHQLSTESGAEPMPVEQGREGVEWILVPCTRFDESVQFFEQTLKLPIQARGTPVSDLRFHRYAQFRTHSGVTLELVEPIATQRALFSGPVVSLTVSDLRAARTRLHDRGVTVLTDFVDDSNGCGWFYVRVPGSTTFQISGPFTA